MEYSLSKFDFPIIDIESRLLIIVQPCHLNQDNNRQNLTKDDTKDSSENREWTNRAVRTIQKTRIQVDLMTLEDDTLSCQIMQRKPIAHGLNDFTLLDFPAECSEGNELIATTNKDSVAQKSDLIEDIPGIGNDFLRKIFDSIKTRMEHRPYSLLIVFGVTSAKVINELVEDICKVLTKKTTRVLIESRCPGNVDNRPKDDAMERTCISLSNGTILAHLKEESVFVYKRKDGQLDHFDLSFDAVTFATIAYTLAFGLPIDKIQGLLNSKTIYETAVKNFQLNTVQLIKKCGRVVYDRKGLIQLKALIKQSGKTLALTTGCFDIFHAGHAAMLQEGKDQADVFIVALNSDESIRLRKGNERPICNLERRTFVLLSLKAVDFIVIFKERRPEWIVDILEPDVFVKGCDYTEEAIRKSFPKLKKVHITAPTLETHTSRIIEVCKKSSEQI